MAADQGLQLADIQEPTLSTFWSLAPLWWLILLIACALMLWAVRSYWLWRQKQAALRQAKAEWSQLTPDDITTINQLLKRLVKHYQPTHPALSGNTEQWQQLLRQLCGCELPQLTDLLYHSQPDPALRQQFYQAVGDWLRTASVKQLEALCSN